METTVLIIISAALLASLAIVVGLAMRLNRSNAEKAEAEKRASVAEATLEQQKQVFDEREKSAKQLLDEREQAFRQRLEEREQIFEERLADARRTVADSFRSMANDTLDATVKRHGEQAARSLESAMAPMKEAFERFSKEFAQRTLDTRAERSVLQEGINALRQLNMQVSDEARRLTHALRGNAGFQGRWGEMVLENILEGSGLEQSRWVVFQESTTTEEGSRLRPDAVIHCPRERDIIIDSKVSLKAYLNMMEAVDETERETFRNDHLHSIENHLRGLGNKEYQARIGAGKAGFVLMFIPHEGAYLTAMQANPDLWQRAYDRHVVIVSPTHLITVVRLVEQMWQTEDQTAHSIAIAEEATKMLDQLNDFLGDLIGVETALEKASQAAASAHKRLATGNGNVIRRAERLNTLGIKTKKALRMTSDEAGEDEKPVSGAQIAAARE